MYQSTEFQNSLSAKDTALSTDFRPVMGVNLKSTREAVSAPLQCNVTFFAMGTATCWLPLNCDAESLSEYHRDIRFSDDKGG